MPDLPAEIGGPGETFATWIAAWLRSFGGDAVERIGRLRRQADDALARVSDASTGELVELRTAAGALVNSLDEPRRTLALLDLSGRSLDEIAAALGMTVAEARYRRDQHRRDLVRRLASSRSDRRAPTRRTDASHRRKPCDYRLPQGERPSALESARAEADRGPLPHFAPTARGSSARAGAVNCPI